MATYYCFPIAPLSRYGEAPQLAEVAARVAPANQLDTCDVRDAYGDVLIADVDLAELYAPNGPLDAPTLWRRNDTLLRGYPTSTDTVAQRDALFATLEPLATGTPPEDLAPDTARQVYAYLHTIYARIDAQHRAANAPYVSSELFPFAALFGTAGERQLFAVTRAMFHWACRAPTFPDPIFNNLFQEIVTEMLDRKTLPQWEPAIRDCGRSTFPMRRHRMREIIHTETTIDSPVLQERFARAQFTILLVWESDTEESTAETIRRLDLLSERVEDAQGAVLSFRRSPSAPLATATTRWTDMAAWLPRPQIARPFPVPLNLPDLTTFVVSPTGTVLFVHYGRDGLLPALASALPGVLTDRQFGQP